MIKFTLIFFILLHSNGICQTFVNIEFISDTALTDEHICPVINHSNPIDTFQFSNYKKSIYAYAVIRDKYGVFERFADSAIWVSSDSNKITISSTPNKHFECIINRKREFVEGTTSIIVSENYENSIPDTLPIRMAFDGSSIRLIDSDKNVSIDTIKCQVGDSIKLRIQSAPPMLQWVEDSAFWKVEGDSINFSYSVPSKISSSWLFKPLSSGNGILTINLGGYMDKAIPILVSPIIISIQNKYSKRNSTSFSFQNKGLNGNMIKCKDLKIFTLNGQLFYLNDNNNLLRSHFRNGLFIIESNTNKNRTVNLSIK